MKRPFILLSLALAAIGMNAQTRLFHTGDHTGYPYRIPAIATAVNGDVIALSDLRPCGGDIGYGHIRTTCLPVWTGSFPPISMG